MKAVDNLSLCLSFLGVYSIIICPRYLLPRNVAPLLSTILDEAHQLLVHAEEIGALSLQSEYKRKLDRYEDLRIPDCHYISHSDLVQHTNLRSCVRRAITPGGYSSKYTLLSWAV